MFLKGSGKCNPTNYKKEPYLNSAWCHFVPSRPEISQINLLYNVINCDFTWNPPDFTWNPHEICQISCEICTNSAGFHLKSAGFHLKSAGFHEIKNASFWVITKYRSFLRKTNKSNFKMVFLILQNCRHVRLVTSHAETTSVSQRSGCVTETMIVVTTRTN